MSAEASEKDRYESLKKIYDGKSVAECFANLHLKLESDVQTVKADLCEVKERVDNLDAHQHLVNDNIEEITNRIVPRLEEEINSEERERLKLQMWGRKWNLVIGGQEGKPDEIPKATDVVVRGFLVKQLEFPQERVNAMLFQAVHRLPGGLDKNKRKIIVRFNNLIDRDDVLAAGMKLQRGSGTSIVPDVPPLVGILRYRLLSERRSLPPEEQKNTRLVYLKEHPFVMLKKRTKKQ